MKNLFDIVRFSKIKTFLSNDIIVLLVIGGYVCFTYVAFLSMSPLLCDFGKAPNDFWLGLLEDVFLFPLYTVIYLLFLGAAKLFFMRRKMYVLLRIIFICSIILTGLAVWQFTLTFKYNWSLLGLIILMFKLPFNVCFFVAGCSVALKYSKDVKEQAERELVPTQQSCDIIFSVLGVVVLILAGSYNLMSGVRVCCQSGGVDNCKNGRVEHLRWGFLYGRSVRYDYDGNIEEITEYKNGCPDGTAIDYYDYNRGRILSIDNFKSCHLHGERVHYDIDGEKKCEFYIEGVKVSEKEWFKYKSTHSDEDMGTNECDQKVVKSLKNGELLKSEYNKGCLQGTNTLFYDEKGKHIKQLENYQNCQLHGEKVFYDERGLIYDCKFYIEGVEVSDDEWTVYKRDHQNEDLGTNECDT
ncbi:MAG: hypothetical protein NC218_01225 [Acetobacter sp.]|nr:hypothetical protein [Acetobacter sp.]